MKRKLSVEGLVRNGNRLQGQAGDGGKADPFRDLLADVEKLERQFVAAVGGCGLSWLDAAYRFNAGVKLMRDALRAMSARTAGASVEIPPAAYDRFERHALVKSLLAPGMQVLAETWYNRGQDAEGKTGEITRIPTDVSSCGCDVRIDDDKPRLYHWNDISVNVGDLMEPEEAEKSQVAAA